MARRHLSLGRENAFNNRQTSRTIGRLGFLFVHSEGRGQNARMGVGDTQPFKDTLNAPILTPTAMQSIEHNVRTFGIEARRQIGARINRDRLEPSSL